jgi:osmoprotectant transport system substrate-binding protein
MNRVLAVTASLVTVAALTACGANGSSSATGAPAPRQPAPSAVGPLPSAPGSVTIGSAGFPESELLAYLYADAMKANGVHVTVHANIGERPAYMAALTDGSIDAVPEYSGAILGYLDRSYTARTPQDVYAQLQRYARSQGLAVTNYAAAQDVDTITVTRATAAKYHLSSIADLAGVAGTLSLGAPAPFQTVPYGTPALKDVYHVAFGRFVPLSAGGSITQTALRNGTVDAADIFSTDPSIVTDGFVSLKDPENIFAAENVVPLFRQNVLTQPMADASNAVSAKLDTATLRTLVAAVASGTDPATVAAQWVSQNGLG